MSYTVTDESCKKTYLLDQLYVSPFSQLNLSRKRNKTSSVNSFYFRLSTHQAACQGWCGAAQSAVSHPHQVACAPKTCASLV